MDRVNETRHWLSNFVPFEEPLTYQGMRFATPEHFYQAMKAPKQDVETRRRIAGAPSPAEAKRLGRGVTLRADWDVIKEDVMRYALRHKFQPGTRAHALLMQSEGDLIETNRWHDTYWGRCLCARCQGQGKNRLGILLMELRGRHAEPDAAEQGAAGGEPPAQAPKAKPPLPTRDQPTEYLGESDQTCEFHHQQVRIYRLPRKGIVYAHPLTSGRWCALRTPPTAAAHATPAAATPAETLCYA